MPDIHLPETQKIVLSVNDSATMGQDMFQWFYENGLTLVRARSTGRAMELLNRAQFDAVISNLRRFENGAQNNNAGIDLVQQIRRVNTSIPVLIYTMNIDHATRQSATSSGANFITTSPAELQAALKKHVL